MIDEARLDIVYNCRLETTSVEWRSDFTAEEAKKKQDFQTTVRIKFAGRSSIRFLSIVIPVQTRKIDFRPGKKCGRTCVLRAEYITNKISTATYDAWVNEAAFWMKRNGRGEL